MSSAPPRSGHWTFTAVAGVLCSPALLWGTYRSYEATAGCLAGHGVRMDDPDADLPEACNGIASVYVLLLIASAVFVAATAVTGLCVGVAEGRRRRGFGHRRWVMVAIVGITVPWALVTYAAGYGIGRLQPALVIRPRSVSAALADGRHAARETLAYLMRGGRPGAVAAPGFLANEPVYLDVPLNYARHYGTTVTYTQTSVAAVGSASFVLGATAMNAIGNSATRARAERMAAPQWREQQLARVILTPTRTWCNVNGRWLSFEHAGVMEYRVAGDSVFLTFSDTEPLCLTGPAAWAHAVFFGYFRFGADGLATLPFLYDLRAPDLQTPVSAGEPADVTPA